MARHDAESFDAPLALVYIAGNLFDAESAERVLTEGGVEYAVNLEQFKHESVLSAVFGNTYNGLFFYVPSAAHRTALNILEGAGMTDTVALTLEKYNEDSHAA